MMQFSRSVAIALVAGCAACSAAPTRRPSIRIESLPGPSSSRGSEAMLRGIVAGVAPREHRIAGYLYVDGAGWWSKPENESRSVAIARDGSFALPVVDGGLDDFATIYTVALVVNGTAPPLARGAARVPADLTSVTLDSRTRFHRTLRFAGRSWGVKEAPLPVGPGSNHFSASEDSVFVDADGRLHLTVRRNGDAWCSSEVVLLDSLGYGVYSIQTDSRLDRLDPRVTFGAFLWDPFGDGDADSGNPHREIDFEDTRWGDAADTNTSQFVVQPFAVPGHLHRYALPDLSEDARITRVFTWAPASLRFAAARGFHSTSAMPESDVFAEFVHFHEPEHGRSVPAPGRELFHMNVWMNSAELGGTVPPVPPAEEVEVVVRSFEFVPAQRSDVRPGPDG